MSFRPRALAAALAIFAVLVVPAAAAAGSPIDLQVLVGDGCASGTGPPRTLHVVTLRTPDGELRGRARDTSRRDGSWSVCFGFFSGPGMINGGDRLRVRAGTTIRDVIVPDLMPRVDRDEDTITGHARAGETVNVFLASGGTGETLDLAVEADSRGRYEVDTTGRLDIRGNDFVQVLVQRPRALFGALLIAPTLVVTYADNSVTGAVAHGRSVKLVLRDRDGNVKGRAHAGQTAYGIFEAPLFDERGRAAYPVAGDRLTASIADDATVRIPAASLEGDASLDRVRGRCMRNAHYSISTFGGFVEGTTAADGTFSRRLQLRRNESFSVHCQYPSGDLLRVMASAHR